LKNPLRVRRKGKAQEGQHFIRVTKLTVVEFVEKRTKVEAFENWKFFQVWEGVCKLRRAKQPSDRRRKEIWTIGFHVQEAHRKNGSEPLDLERST
jgi:hypothetical protein